MLVDFGIIILSVAMPFSYVALPSPFSPFSSPSLTNIANKTLILSILSSLVRVVDRAEGLCLLSLGSYVQDIADASEVIILLGKAWEINSDF